MSDKILIFPFGGNAREAANAIHQINQADVIYELIGYVDDDPGLIGQSSCGGRVLGGRAVLDQYTQAKVLNVVGSPANYLKRRSIIEGFGIAPERYASVVHSSAAIAEDVEIGCNVLVCANVTISPGAKIGDHCIVLPNTSIGHDTVIGDFTCIAANVALAGSVTVEQNCYIGAGSVIRDHITIGSQSLVGCGANVIEDVASQTTVVGNPAKMIKRESA